MNISGILEAFDQLPGFKSLLSEVTAGSVAEPLGLPPSVRPPTLARLFMSTRRTMLLISGRVESVPTWMQALESWLPPGVNLARFPEPTPLPYERGPWSNISRNGRLSVLTQLMKGQHPMLPHPESPLLVVTSARALLHHTLPRRRFVSATRLLRPNQIVDLEKLERAWLSAGYEPVSVVESVGQFSRRGGIIDIFPVGVERPVRLELFGDEIETIREFDPSTQRSLAADDTVALSIVVPPAREVLPTDAVSFGIKHERDLELSNESELPSWRDDIPMLASGVPTPHLEFYLPVIYSQPSSLLDYLPDGTPIVIDDCGELEASVADVHQHAGQVSQEHLDLPLDYPSPLIEWKDLIMQLGSRTVIELGEGREKERQVEGALANSFRPGPKLGGQVRPFLVELRKAQAHQERTVVVSRQAHRLAELWRKDSDDASALSTSSHITPVDSLPEMPSRGSTTFVQGSLAGGFTLENLDTADTESSSNGFLLNFLTDAEVFGWSRPVPRRTSRPRKVAPENYFADINPGDFVVHLEFGIGRFIGLVIRSIGGMQREYLQVNYKNSDVLYVPVHHADRLSKWIGTDDRIPVFHRLGEKTWRRTKAKAQKAVDELAEDLLDLYAVRETVRGYGFSPDTPWQGELEASFPYRETEDQMRAIAEVKADMERPFPMDRLICGDVGYGKTEVALRGAFKVVMDGKQVAILVPTTVLAQQHYNTFRERLKTFPVNVEMLSRFRTQARQEKIVRELSDGKVDVVIGTHRLFSADVIFHDLGLLIIDEEQRFGVAHKEKLKQLRTEVDVLTMTATPIPRTLYMSLAGVRDISHIDTAPEDRLPVQTYVGEAEDALMRRAILREIDRNGQVFFVHNRVQTIKQMVLKLSGLVPEAVIAIGHGQMSERELEDVMLRFVEGEIDVLVSTSIIESGLDIPNANTLIVDQADQFGLAQLYQLRGRVGRGVRRAYAYFFHRQWHRLSADARARLDIISSQTDLGAGYSIAMRDLEIRGAGDLLGAKQSGHIAAVGFDLYTRLLSQAVKRRRAEANGRKMPIELPEAVLIDLPIAAYIPTNYVPDTSLRLRLYRRMAVLESLEDIDNIAEELADRFGTIPDPVDNLLFQLRIKTLATAAGVSAVATEVGQLQIRLPEQNGSNRIRLQGSLGDKVRVSRKAIWLGRDLEEREWRILLVQILEKLGSIELVPVV
ncbi:MAG: transcription-repair coupling factor [Candidatus Promineifilaceae bacterium]